MNEALIVLPVLVPFVTGVLGILAWGRPAVQRFFMLVGMLILTGVGATLVHVVNTQGIQAEQLGDWPAPFGITIVADLFSALMVLITGIMGLTVTVYSFSSIDSARTFYGFYPLMSIMIMGVCGAFITGDVFNMYVWFEVLLTSSFVLLVLGSERPQLAGAVQYMTLNLIGSAFFLEAAGLLYATAGTLNMADLAVHLAEVEEDGVVTAIGLMLMVAFGIKAAIFPLFFWLPVSYHTPPVSVSAIFAALLTKVGVYALIRIFTLLFVQDIDFTHGILMLLGGLTMVTGVFGAMAQYDFRRLLSFHIISQIGYMIMGLALMTPLALGGAIYYVLHNILAKTNLFLVSGVVHRLRGTYDLHDLGGLYRAYPLLGVLFLIPALSLAGIPPLSGFWAKFMLVRGGLEAEEYLITAAALFTGVWTLYSMMKIWSEAFLKEAHHHDDDGPESDDGHGDVSPSPPLWTGETWLMLGPVIILAGLTVFMGVAIEPIFEITHKAAEQLLDPSGYIEAVLGEG